MPHAHSLMYLSTVPPPLPNSQQHPGVGSAILVVSFRLKLQESPIKIARFLPAGPLCIMGTSALVPVNLDSLELQGSAGSVTNRQNKLARERVSLPNLPG